MENERYRGTESIIDPAVEEYTFRAAQNEKIIQTVEHAPDTLEAIRAVRELLRELYPEIKDIPEPKPGPDQQMIGGIASNEYRIAKGIVILLRKNQESEKS
ncbi:MAG: hypothetical protein A3A97_04905 [Candidatus Terrybacteria bacterium RIFCSPLOWO2_01_FULL_40_23]|uniref:Uncharacterized protein n=1 Tax=Candidatus Terrybacteria bacterium RIFCSPLOWO2_01_FULL_40_23 TaxID=1802366 RepID=A0A1G2PV75_9BACT|nr:MAG: hypothetical protein A3A97_04905 [Candidatus Terrybacteria bacterium RIFCSPLOWO2_01_FULL_40_23]